MTDEREETIIHAWLSGQADNIGDSALRRAYANALRRSGRLSAWVGDPGSAYAAGVALADSELCRSFASWCFTILRTCWSGRAVFAFNAGEFVPTKRYLAGMALLLPVLAVHRARGGRFVWLGAGVRPAREPLLWPFRLLASWSEPLAFRDRTSIDLIGSGMSMPDWAFALQAREDQSDVAPRDAVRIRRDRIAVVLRGDREVPSQAWVDEVKAFARRLSAEVIVVVQVERDRRAAREVAERLGARFVDWRPGLNHLQQEAVVRAEYARTVAVLSDRLHALIIASTEGAVPLGWCETANDKISRHFDLIGALWVAHRQGDLNDAISGLDDVGLDRLAVENRRIVQLARDELAAVSEQLTSGNGVG